MKIKKIVAKNFKSYDELVFEPKNVTYAVVGPNGTGKTTTEQIIRYALTGDYPDEPIKKGCSEMEVSTLLEDGTDFSRSRSAAKTQKLRLNGKAVVGKKLQEYLEEISGVPMEGIKLSSSADLIEHLKPEEFGDFIMKYVPEELDINIIKRYMGPVDPAVTKMLESYMPTSETFGYEQINQTYNNVFDQRKLWNKNLKEHEARVNAFKGVEPTQTMEEVNESLEKILKREGEIDGMRIALKSYNNAVESRKIQEKNIAALEKQIASSTATRPLPSAIAEITKSKQAIHDEIVSLSAVLRSMEDNLELFKSALENLNKPFCPLSERLCCTTDKSSLKEEFEESIKATAEGIEMQKKLIVNKRAELPALVAKEKEYNDNVIAYNKKVTWMNELEQRKKELVTIPEKPKELPTDTEILEEQKKNLYSLRDQILRWEQHEKDCDELAKLALNKKVADILVELLRPNGKVVTAVTSHYFEVFEDLCNDTIQKINPEYSVRFIPDKGIRIECETKKGRGYVPYECVSSGERACVIFALMNLISNDLTQLNIMVLDDLDKLDKDTFDALISYIMDPDVQSKYDHIIISAVNHEDTLKTLKSYSNIDLIEL